MMVIISATDPNSDGIAPPREAAMGTLSRLHGVYVRLLQYSLHEEACVLKS